MRFFDLLLRCKAPRGFTGAAAATLRGMSERELSDLGIGRSEIPAVLAEPPSQPRAMQPPVLRRLPA